MGVPERSPGSVPVYLSQMPVPEVTLTSRRGVPGRVFGSGLPPGLRGLASKVPKPGFPEDLVEKVAPKCPKTTIFGDFGVQSAPKPRFLAFLDPKPPKMGFLGVRPPQNGVLGGLPPLFGGPGTPKMGVLGVPGPPKWQFWTQSRGGPLQWASLPPIPRGIQ